MGSLGANNANKFGGRNWVISVRYELSWVAQKTIGSVKTGTRFLDPVENRHKRFRGKNSQNGKTSQLVVFV